MKRKLEIVAFMMIFGAFAAHATVTAPSDGALAAQVTKRLRDANFDSVTVTVHDHMATLAGSVDRLSKAERAYQVARKTDGLSGVENHIAIASSRSDDEIARDITHEIRVFPFYDIFDLVNGEVKDGVVTLRGAVRLPQRFNDYANLAKQVSGVKAVNNQLEVLPTSAYDDQIRVRVARAIYGSPALGFRYGNQALPPIHIIVKNGNVRLEGVVLNQLDKQLAEQAARFAATYFQLQNNLQISNS
ncbi:MAG: BON domain-containing protein [Acidobacteria bacterium]|nr:BON domain-containing protein [Acidobacteriota bacterium]